ncbi:MAG: hypothetical protein KAR20_24710 [Candidatus Heimdallarchaeota archaeon]|nr:hypothetical protein [Candidatus Heimdallarchaeota archaeon]
MRKLIIIALLCLSVGFVYQEANAGFDDILKEVFLENRSPIGSNEYEFHPGDVVVEKTAYVVYYTGYELVGDVRAIRFNVFEAERSYPLLFPSPDVIQIKDVKLQIISFDNVSLRLRLVPTQQRRY